MYQGCNQVPPSDSSSPAAYRTSACLAWRQTMGRHSDVVRVWIRALGLYGVLTVFGVWLGLHVLPHGPTWVNGGLFRRAWFWDGGWYLSIAEHGYAWNGHAGIQQNVAFFPLYPLIERLFHGLGFSWAAAAIIPSLLFAIPLPLIFSALLRHANADIRRDLATYALMLYPGAQFYLAGYPTSLMNVIVMLGLWAILARRYWLAATIAGIGTAAGPLMMLLSMVVCGSYIHDRFRGSDVDMGRTFGSLLAMGALAISGFLSYTGFLYARFGDPLAFLQVQRAWGHLPLATHVYRFLTLAGVFGGGYSKFLMSLIPFANTQPLRVFEASLQNTLNTFTFVILACSLWYARRRLPRVMMLYAALVLVAYLWLLGSVQGPVSTARLVFIAIPAFIAIGSMASRFPRITSGILLFFALTLVVQTALFVAGYWVV